MQLLHAAGIRGLAELAQAVARHSSTLIRGMRRCEQVPYNPPECFFTPPEHRGWLLWMLVQLLYAEKATEAETVEGFKRIGLYIAAPDSVQDYARSLRQIVRG